MLVPHSCENKAISAPSWGLAGWGLGWAWKYSGHYVIASSLPPERLRPNDDRWNAAPSCQKLQFLYFGVEIVNMYSGIFGHVTFISAIFGYQTITFAVFKLRKECQLWNIKFYFLCLAVNISSVLFSLSTRDNNTKQNRKSFIWKTIKRISTTTAKVRCL